MSAKHGFKHVRVLVWHSVREQMPDDEITVLVAGDGEDSEVSMAWHADGVWRLCASAEIIEDVTHWMLLPDPPAFTKKTEVA